MNTTFPYHEIRDLVQAHPELIERIEVNVILRTPAPPAVAAQPAQKKKGPTGEDRYLADVGRVGVMPGGAIPLELYNRLTRVPPQRRVLAFGAGVSTLVLSKRVKNLTVVDHSPERLLDIKRICGDGVRYIHSDIANGWYDWRPRYGERFDVILIDGPPHEDPTLPGFTGRLSALEPVADMLASGGVIFVDDTHQPEEQALAEQLSRQLGLNAFATVSGDRRFHALIPPPEPMGDGPGTELTLIFARHEVDHCQRCEFLARRMNKWGVAGCEERFEEIVTDIFPRAKNWLKAKRPFALSMFSTVAGKKNTDAALRTLIGGYVRQAIEAAREKGLPAPELKRLESDIAATDPALLELPAIVQAAIIDAA